MGLFSKRKSRATRRAEARALKAKAKLEAKLEAKNQIRRIKAEERRENRALRAQVKAQRDADRTAVKVAEVQLKAAREGKLLSPARVRRVLTVARLLAPVLVPLAYRGATAARGFLDQRKADKLGVPLSQVGQFSGQTSMSVGWYRCDRSKPLRRPVGAGENIIARAALVSFPGGLRARRRRRSARSR